MAILQRDQLDDFLAIRELDPTKLQTAVERLRQVKPVPMRPDRLISVIAEGLAEERDAADSVVRQALMLYSGILHGGKKVEDSDWIRVGRVYAEAGEWDKAQGAFDRALAMKADDDSGMIEYGALANLNKDRAKAEALFEKAMKKSPREFWHWVGAGASYLGVRPQSEL